MNELFKNWTEGWAASQQAFMKSMFPLAATEGAESAKPPLEEHFAELRDTWKASVDKWSKLAGDGAQARPLTPEALRELFAPAQWSGPGAGSFDGALRHVLEGPKYATLWDMDRKLAELQQHALQRDRAVAAYQAVVQKGWNQAFSKFSNGFAANDDKTPLTWRSLVDRWLAVANDTLIEVHRSSEFVEAQREMLRAASDYRLKERAIAEAWCEVSNIPTRTEMDEMQRTVTELRRQLRAQQRSMTAPHADAEAAAACRPRASSRTARSS